jgi:hypothetical protein
MSDIQFVNGLIVKAPHPKAPDFVKANLSIKREELIQTLQAMQGDWVNVSVKESKGGKWYAAVDTWEPNQSAPSGQQSAPPADDFDQEIPF